jgi:vesicle coat complex subunit
MKHYLILLLFAASFASCKKDSNQDACVLLQQGLIADDTQKVGKAVDQIIAAFASKEYNAQNIDILVNRLSQCNLEIRGKCFDCIKTLPSQTEIWFRYNASGTIIQKTIDISYTPDNKMRFHNMHD